MALRDLGSYLEDDGLEYPVKSSSFPDGKVYRVPSPDAKTGLWLTAIADVGLSGSPSAMLKLDDDDERDLYQRVLGSAYDEMINDGVSWSALQKVGQDAYLCFAMSQQVADASLELAAGKAPAPNRAARRATAKKTAGGKSSRVSGGSAKRTRAPASPASSTPPNGSADQDNAAAI